MPRTQVEESISYVPDIKEFIREREMGVDEAIDLMMVCLSFLKAIEQVEVTEPHSLYRKVVKFKAGNLTHKTSYCLQLLSHGDDITEDARTLVKALAKMI